MLVVLVCVRACVRVCVCERERESLWDTGLVCATITYLQISTFTLIRVNSRKVDLLIMFFP